MGELRHHERVRSTAGTSELKIVLDPKTDFGDIVRYLEKTLTIPEIPGVRGCAPCYSGIDRLVIESLVIDQVG